MNQELRCSLEAVAELLWSALEAVDAMNDANGCAMLDIEKKITIAFGILQDLGVHGDIISGTKSKNTVGLRVVRRAPSPRPSSELPDLQEPADKIDRIIRDAMALKQSRNCQ